LRVRTAPPSFPTRRSSDLRAVPEHFVVALQLPLGVPGAFAARAALRVVHRFADQPSLLVEKLVRAGGALRPTRVHREMGDPGALDRKSTRLNSSHVKISYA